MPVFCAAYGCSNRRSTESKSRGITFHKFPRDVELRRKWEAAARTDGFVSTQFSKLCSEHFRPEDVDRTGQIVRLRDGATPSVFSFPPRPQTPVSTRNTEPSAKAEERPPVDVCLHCPDSEAQPSDDHCYALPSSPSHLKARLSEALARVELLERENVNARARERRAKRMVENLLEDLRRNAFSKENGCTSAKLHRRRRKLRSNRKKRGDEDQSL